MKVLLGVTVLVQLLFVFESWKATPQLQVSSLCILFSVCVSVDCVGAFVFVEKLDGNAGNLAFLPLQSLISKALSAAHGLPKASTCSKSTGENFFLFIISGMLV